MKKIKIIGFLAILIAAFSLQSCLKSAPMNIDINNKTADIVELQFLQPGGSTINSGLTYFTGGISTYAGDDVADTVTYNVSLGGATTLSTDLGVTVGVDSTRLLDNYSTDSINYSVLPDSVYHLVATTATIKAGQRIAPMKLVFYPSKVDTTKKYVLPITIKNASGQVISSNFGTVYFQLHIRGNPLAITYVMTGTRYNYSGNVAWSGPPSIPAGNIGTTPYSANITAVQLTAKTIQMVMGNVPDPSGGSAMYLITATSSAFTDITYTFPDTFLAGYSGITTYVVNYVKGTASVKTSFHLMTKYTNGVGNDRLIDQTFTQK